MKIFFNHDTCPPPNPVYKNFYPRGTFSTLTPHYPSVVCYLVTTECGYAPGNGSSYTTQPLIFMPSESCRPCPVTTVTSMCTTKKSSSQTIADSFCYQSIFCAWDATLYTIEISAPVAHPTYATGCHVNRNMYILSLCFKVVWHKLLSKVPLKVRKGCLPWDQTTSSFTPLSPAR